MKKVIAIAYRRKGTNEKIRLKVLSLEEIKDLNEEVFGQRESFSHEPIDVCESILEKMMINNDIYSDYTAEEI